MIRIKQLCIAVTSKCNLKCIHCMKGNSGNTTITYEQLNALFSQIEYVEKLHISGGEPTLELETIKHMLQSLKENHVIVNSFGFVTNGMLYNEDIADILKKLITYSASKKCEILISGDIFHFADTKNGRIVIDKARRKKWEENVIKYTEAFHDVNIQRQADYGVVDLGNAKKNKLMIMKNLPNIIHINPAPYRYIGLTTDGMYEELCVTGLGNITSVENDKGIICTVFDDINKKITEFNNLPKIKTLGRLNQLITEISRYDGDFETIKARYKKKILELYFDSVLTISDKYDWEYLQNDVREWINEIYEDDKNHIKKIGECINARKL